MSVGGLITSLMMPGVFVPAGSQRTRTRLYAFSNSNPTHHADWSARYADTLRLFHRVFVSSELGARKPEAAAFRAVAAAVGVPLAAMVFFDDTVENVEAARALGLRAVHVRSFADVQASLAAVLA